MSGRISGAVKRVGLGVCVFLFFFAYSFFFCLPIVLLCFLLSSLLFCFLCFLIFMFFPFSLSDHFLSLSASSPSFTFYFFLSYDFLSSPFSYHLHQNYLFLLISYRNFFLLPTSLTFAHLSVGTDYKRRKNREKGEKKNKENERKDKRSEKIEVNGKCQ